MNKNMRWPCPKLGGIPQLMATSEIAWWFQPLLDHHRADLDCRSTRVMSLAHCSAFCDVGGPRVEGRTLTVVLALCWSLEFSSTQMESTYIFVGALWNQCNWLCWWFGTAYCVVRILPSIRSIHLSIYPYIYIYIWLVVWHIFYDFPYIGNFIIPTDELHHLSEGLGWNHQPGLLEGIFH